LSHDEWIVRLYGTNLETVNFTEYHDRVLSLLWQIAGEFIERDIDVVLDHGFWTRRSRDEASAVVVNLGGTPKLYRMACSDAVADARVLMRAKTGATDCLKIDEHALRIFHSKYEPLQPDEDHRRPSTSPYIVPSDKVFCRLEEVEDSRRNWMRPGRKPTCAGGLQTVAAIHCDVADDDFG
jgi:predicted kinase